MRTELRKWDPFRDLGEFPRRLSTLFGRELGELASFDEDADWLPAVDVAEDDDAYLVTADLPEVDKEHAKVVVRDGILTISGERKREMEEEDKKRKIYRIERSYGSYQRSFRVPDNVNEAEISADFKDGVLHVTLPKAEVAEPEEHRIEVQ